ncbi:MAG: formimidoylglutamate deiminase, partial [Myxococcota bacterium]
APVDARWCLVHATHTTPDEIAGIAASGASVAICPTTEANLGDGLFALSEFLAARGVFSIGSDSHCSVDPREELRLLEYGQRLTRRARNIVASAEQPSTGARLWLGAAAGGAAALGAPIGSLEVGCGADFVTLDPEHPCLLGHGLSTALDALVFSAGRYSPVCDVVVGGVRVVRGGRHVRRDAVRARYAETMRRIKGAS